MTKAKKNSKKKVIKRKKVIKVIKQEVENQMQQILKHRALTKETCLHLRTNDDGTWSDRSNVKWMEHSGGIIMGVCGTCFSQFDTRDPGDRIIFNLLYAYDPSVKDMGKARGTYTRPAPVCRQEITIPKKKSLWQRFLNLFR